jgi:hypothetical protein
MIGRSGSTVAVGKTPVPVPGKNPVPVPVPIGNPPVPVPIGNPPVPVPVGNPVPVPVPAPVPVGNPLNENQPLCGKGKGPLTGRRPPPQAQEG